MMKKKIKSQKVRQTLEYLEDRNSSDLKIKNSYRG